jgi:hypothetical protein
MVESCHSRLGREGLEKHRERLAPRTPLLGERVSRSSQVGPQNLEQRRLRPGAALDLVLEPLQQRGEVGQVVLAFALEPWVVLELERVGAKQLVRLELVGAEAETHHAGPPHK